MIEMASILAYASSCAPNFISFVHALRTAGYTLCVSEHGITVSDGQHEWADRNPREPFVRKYVECFFWHNVDFTPGGLAHKYLTLRLRWIEKSGFREDMMAYVLDTLREPIRRLDTAFLCTQLDAVFESCSELRSGDATQPLGQRDIQFMNAVGAAAGERFPWDRSPQT